jgi:hypothetical protein
MLGSIFTRFDLNGFVTRGILIPGNAPHISTISATGVISAGLGLLVVLWVSYLGRGEVDARERMGRWHWTLRYATVGLVFLVMS